jgi:outer membrane receptor protein involved in Fe transport
VTFFGRASKADSLYGELRAPIVSPDNHVPFVHLLELQIASRRSWYDLNASNISSSLNPVPEVRTRRRFVSFDPTFGVKWAPTPDIMFRASYGTGFLPPALNQLTPDPPTVIPGFLFAFFGVTDPQRGNEALGGFGDITVTGGGNPALGPERSTSLSLGAILTPRFIPGFRLSVDWTRIRKRNNIFAASGLPFDQALLTRFLQQVPGRFTRSTDPATFNGFSVGPITAIDSSYLNIASEEIQALDFAFGQQFRTRRLGNFDLSVRATRNLRDATRTDALSPEIDELSLPNRVKWRGNLALDWSLGGWSARWSAYYTGPYDVPPNWVASQGSTRIASQIYNDLYLAYAFPNGRGLLRGFQISLDVQNIFDRSPPISLGQPGSFIGLFSNPLRSTYALTLRKRF